MTLSQFLICLAAALVLGVLGSVVFGVKTYHSSSLAIAMALLSAQQPERFSGLDKTVFLGELSLQGKLLPVRGALGMAITAVENGYENLILPKENAMEVACMEGLNIYPASSLTEVCRHMAGDEVIAPIKCISF